MQTDEKSLVEALHRGERYACDELVARYRSQIYQTALRLSGNPTEAEEILQETLINACRSVEAFEGRSSLTTWLYRISTNNGLMRRRRPKTPTVPIDPTPETEESPSVQLQDQTWDPEMMTLTDELQTKMEEAIASLPETLRSVLILRDLRQLSTKETAAHLDISSNNVKVRLHRARQLLRERLAQYVDESSGYKLDA